MIQRTIAAAVVVVALLGAAPDAWAQERPMVGVVGGLDRSTVFYDPNPDVDLEGQTAGWAAFLVQVPFNEIAGLDARLGWSRTRIKATAEDGSISARVDSLVVPIMLSLRVPRDGVTPYGLVGFELGFKTGASSEITADGVTVDDPEFDEGIRDSTVSLNVGAGVEIPAGRSSFLVELLYAHGVRNIAIDEPGGPRVLPRHLRFNVGIRF